MALDPVLHAEMVQLIQREKELTPKLALLEQNIEKARPPYLALKAQFEALKQQFEAAHAALSQLEQQKSEVQQELQFIEQDKQKLRMQQRVGEAHGEQRTAQAQQLLGQFAELGVKPDVAAKEVKEIDLESQLAALKQKMDNKE
ncbi:MAG: hypothetical protein KC609_14540 [Myxococcales bacterium]|nr:hypothetical protein [Myxococcales bacterium]